MVKVGHSSRPIASTGPPIEPVHFQNPSHPNLGLEVLSLTQLRQILPPHHRRVRTRPNFHQLMLIETGSIEHDVDFVRQRCRAGSVLYLRPGQVQRWVRDTPAEGWVALFRPEFLLPEPLLDAHIAPLDVNVIALSPGDRAPITLAMRALATAYETASAEAQSSRVLQHLLIALLLQIARASEATRALTQPQPPSMLRVYHRFLQVLERDFERKREVAYFAKCAGCSTKTLSRACALLAGAAPKRLIERRVALEAKRLLAHSPLAVSAIGTQLGFTEPTNFVKFFRRSESLTPAAFRERATLNRH